MPLPLIAAGIGAAAGLIQSGIQGRQNKKQREWNEHMYNMQRQHQLQDWNMVNKYNSPEQQMARFEEAGLNKNLIYGQGSSGEAQAVKPADIKSWNPQTANFSGAISGAVDSYISASKAAQEIANMKAQERKTDAETLFIESHRGPYYQSLIDVNKGRLPLLEKQTEGADYANKLMNQRLYFNEQMNPELIKYQKGRIQEVYDHRMLMQAQRQFSLSENKRQEQMQFWNIGLAATTILQKKAETARTIKDTERIGEAIELIKTTNFQNDLENLMRLGGRSYKDGYLTRNATGFLGITEDLNRVGRAAVGPAWDKMNDNQKRNWYLEKRSLQFFKP